VIFGGKHDEVRTLARGGADVHGGEGGAIAGVVVVAGDVVDLIFGDKLAKKLNSSLSSRWQGRFFKIGATIATTSLTTSVVESDNFGGLQETLSGTMHVHVDNVTYRYVATTSCNVGVTVTPSSITQEINQNFFPFELRNGTFIVYNSTDIQNTTIVICKNVFIAVQNIPRLL